jgi:mxaJ protein
LLLVFASASVFAEPLRVCADPNNLPFSNRAREGFENRLAVMLAQDLGRDLQYVWWTQRKSFLEHTLGENRCDLVLGAPAAAPAVLVTRPYYRSTYVFVTRKSSNIAPTSLLDPRLAEYRIGVHVVDDNYAPPAILLSRQGLTRNLVAFSLYGKEGEADPPEKIVAAVARGDVDLAIVWGPFAGYFAKRENCDLQVTPVSPSSAGPIPFTYSISAAVRKSDEKLRAEIDKAFSRNCGAIRSLLSEYDVPQLPMNRPGSCEGSSHQATGY